MSREERRAYQRQMKGIDRTPGLPPAARARAERNAERRAQRSRQRPRTGVAGAAPFDRRFWLRTIVIAALAGYLGFSLQWGEGVARAAIVGVVVGGVVLALLVGFRYLQGRVPPRP
jgi:hypothetical protein